MTPLILSRSDFKIGSVVAGGAVSADISRDISVNVGNDAAFSVFFWLEVLDFDLPLGFLLLGLHSICLLGCLLLYQWHRRVDAPP